MDLKLTRALPLRNLIFKPDSLENLLRYLSAFYEGSSDKSRWDYDLSITVDEHTGTSANKPPSDYSSILSSAIQNISLSVRNFKEDKHIQLELASGAHSYRNRILFGSSDETWVNSTYESARKLLDHVEPQNTFLTDHRFLIVGISAVSLGWVTLNLIARFTMWMNPPTPANQPHGWTPQQVVTVAIFTFAIGLAVTAPFYTAALSAFPSIEFQTGPSKYWKEAKRRRVWAFVGSLLIIAPLGDFIYDMYRAFLVGH